MTATAPTGLYDGTSVAAALPSLAAVDAQAEAAFHEHGYLAVRHAFDTTAVAAATGAVDALIDGAVPTFKGVQLEPGSGPAADLSLAARRLRVRKLMGFVDHEPRLRALSEDAALLDVVGRLMGGATPVLFQDMALLKPPGGREKPWHQDMAYFNVALDTPVIGVWIALDPATAANGALHLLPGSHRDGPRLHFKRRDWQICDTEVPRGRDVVVPLPPGGALLWHGLLHHGSPVNGSAARRRALQFHYRPSDTTLTTTEQRLQHYGGEVAGAEC